MFVGIGTVCLVIDLVQELVQLGIFRVVIHSVGYMSIQFEQKERRNSSHVFIVSVDVLFSS